MQTTHDDAAATPNGQLSSIGRWLGPLLAVGVWWLGPPTGLTAAAWITVALVTLMVVWWITEAVPIAVTALLPLIVLPLGGVVTLPQAATPYADPIIFLFIGGFMLAMALERWRLHGRLALALIAAVGTRPTSLLLSFGVATAALSMWISNTATALMLMPTAIGVAAAIGEHTDRRTAHQFAFAVVLMVAYGLPLAVLARRSDRRPTSLQWAISNAKASP
jgi:solute carrier family 13 (sodium-dependent dicarboxylate transporter), member 2/3/5